MQPRILLFSHFLDHSGAPMALLELGRALKTLGCHVAMVGGIEGPLGADYQAAGIDPPSAIAGFDLCIANTVLSSHYLPQLKPGAARLAMWVHESPTFYRYAPELDYANIPVDLVDHLLGVADFQVEALRQQFPDTPVSRFDCTFGTLPSPPPVAPPADDTLRICILAHPDKRKGCFRLDEMFDLGAPDRPLHIALTGIDSYDAVGFIRPSRVPPGVTINVTGRLQYDDLIRVIAGADLCLTLSQDEVKPRAVLEFLSLGRPVVASDIPAHRELQAEFPHIVVCESPLAHVWDIAAGRASLAPGDAAAVTAGLARYSPDAFVARARDLVDVFVRPA